MKSQHPRSGIGTTKAKSKQEERQEESACTTSTTLLKSSTKNKNQQKKEAKLSMPESAPTTNEQTSNDKSKILGKRTRTTKSSAKLQAASTSNGSNSIGFWTESSLEISKRLSWHTETGCHVLGSNSLLASARNLTVGSWFTATTKVPTTHMNSVKTCSPLSRCLWQSITAAVEPSNAKSEEPPKKRRKKTQEKEENKTKKKVKEKTPAEKAIRIRLYPNEEQKQTLLKWIGTVRWTYNKVVDAIEKDKIPRTKKALRAKCINTELFNIEDMKWILGTPYDMRDEGMNDVLKAYTSNFAKDTGKPFEIKYRSKKDKQQSVVIHSKYWKCKKGHYAFLHEIESAEPLPTSLEYDSRLIRTRLGEYYICIPKPLELMRENQSHQYSQEEEAEGSGVVALDPGVRTFQTCFSADGTVTEWGKGDMSRIYRLCYAYDDLQSRWSNSKSNGMCKKCRFKKEKNPDHTHCKKCIKHKDVKVNHRKRYRMKKAGLRVLQRIRNLVDELHKKMARWLCLHHRVVLLPEFETSKMLRRGQRRIGSKTARAMATWSHYRFKTRLLNKSREHPDCRVYIVSEAYTSKTCGHCGHIHSELGGSKMFKCPSCKWEIDRDINGARNILIRFLTENLSDSLFGESR